MTTSLVSPPALSRSRIAGLSLAALLLVAVLFGTVLASGAQAAVSYNDQEVAFVTLINNYRVANHLPALLVSDAISLACDRHNSDMAKYKYFDHVTQKSDWFPVGSYPWDRMAASGYNYNTSEGENIAAGQSTAALVFAAWKASSGHNANMLNTKYTVIGVSFYQLAGSPYTYYWTTDFGGYRDATAHVIGSPPAPTTTRYQQTDSHIKYVGTWSTYTTSNASGGSYRRSSTSTASATITFTGTYFAWIATRGTTLGKAYVSLDGGAAQSVNLAATAVAYQQKVWNTPTTLTPGQHTVKIWRDSTSATGKYISVDAIDIIGSF
jgi:uncharacterized protein YkwD